MSRLLPQLDDAYGLDVIESLRGSASSEELVRTHHSEQTFSPTGGSPVSQTGLEAIREAIVEVAGRYGFPGTSLGATTPFDRDCAVSLHTSLGITPNSAANRGMWTFLTCCLLPDVAAWRFSNVATERFLGDVNRNVFRRLWWRVELLGPPPELPDPVWGREDVLVNVMERPGLSGDKTVAREICAVFRSAVEDRGEAEYQGLMRDFMRRVMRRSAFASLSLLPDRKLHELLVGLMRDTIAVADGGEASFLRPALSGEASDQGGTSNGVRTQSAGTAPTDHEPARPSDREVRRLIQRRW